MRLAKALARLRICAVSPEPLLIADAIRIKMLFPCTGSWVAHHWASQPEAFSREQGANVFFVTFGMYEKYITYLSGIYIAPPVRACELS